MYTAIATPTRGPGEMKLEFAYLTIAFGPSLTPVFYRIIIGLIQLAYRYFADLAIRVGLFARK